jgi:hypothetical protein
MFDINRQHRVPSDHITRGQIAENPLAFGYMPAFAIHADKAAANVHIESEPPSFDAFGVKLSSLFAIFPTCTGFQEAHEHVAVGFEPGFPHVGVHPESFAAAAMSDKPREDRPPRKHALKRWQSKQSVEGAFKGATLREVGKQRSIELVPNQGRVDPSGFVGAVEPQGLLRGSMAEVRVCRAPLRLPVVEPVCRIGEEALP